MKITIECETDEVESALRRLIVAVRDAVLPLPAPGIVTITLHSRGSNWIQVIKLLRANLNLGLKEAKELSERSGATFRGTDAFVEALREAGATVSYIRHG